MNSEIQIWDRIPFGVILMIDTGNGFDFMEIDGKPVKFFTEEEATKWLLSE